MVNSLTRFKNIFISTIVIAGLLIGSTVGQIAPIHAVGTNLIANSDVETTSAPNQPANWQFNSWGEITASGSYVTTDTGKSLHVAVTNHTSGDAKWYFTPVAVTPGKTYTFTDRYKSTVASELVAQYTRADGSFAYEWLGEKTANSTWQTSEYLVAPAAGVTHVTIFHLLANSGELWTDNFSLTEDTVTPPPTNGSLISNGSAETAAGSKPAGWTSNSWGALTASFSYLSTGQDGTRSLYSKVTNFQSGDAKWYFDSVNVEAGKKYIFSNQYHATAATDTVARYTKADGSVQYAYLGTNAAAANWTQTTYSFTVPAGITQVSIFHVIAANGELWVDSYALFEDEGNPNPTPVSDIPNASVETPKATNPNQPQGWTTNKWGTNVAQFSYANEGHSGNRSVKTTVQSITDGDAKWFFDPITLTPNREYSFTDYYKSNVDSKLVVAVTKQDGTIQYIDMPTAPAAANWTKYTGTFTMPATGVNATVYHMLTAVGYVMTDDYDIKPYAAVGFNQGMVTLTFDDGWEENTDTALPIMKSFGYKSNQFYATTFIQNSEIDNPKSYIQKFLTAGHEVDSHSITHPDLTTLSNAQLNNELAGSKSYLQNMLGLPINYFATPYGAYNQNVKDRIMSNYTVHRTVDEGYNSKDNFDISRLKVQNILSTTTAEEVAGWVKKAFDDKTWLILVYHRVANDPGPYDTTPALFQAQLQKIKNQNLPVKTITEALNILTPQL